MKLIEQFLQIGFPLDGRITKLRVIPKWNHAQRDIHVENPSESQPTWSVDVVMDGQPNHLATISQSRRTTTELILSIENKPIEETHEILKTTVEQTKLAPDPSGALPLGENRNDSLVMSTIQQNQSEDHNETRLVQEKGVETFLKVDSISEHPLQFVSQSQSELVQTDLNLKDNKQTAVPHETAPAANEVSKSVDASEPVHPKSSHQISHLDTFAEPEKKERDVSLTDLSSIARNIPLPASPQQTTASWKGGELQFIATKTVALSDGHPSASFGELLTSNPKLPPEPSMKIERKEPHPIEYTYVPVIVDSYPRLEELIKIPEYFHHIPLVLQFIRLPHVPIIA
jgi:hypothetical protein